MGSFRNMVVIAAPSCCGKSTFVSQLMADEVPALKGNLPRMDRGGEPWTYRDMFLHEPEIRDLADRGTGNVMLHYTLPYPSLRFWLRPGYDKRSRLAILGASSETTIVTLLACRATLLRRASRRRERIFQRLELRQISRWKAYRLLATLNHLERIYASRDRLQTMYQRWFTFVERLGPAQHHMIDVTGAPRLTSPSEWANVVSTWDEAIRVDSSRTASEATRPGTIVAHGA